CATISPEAVIGLLSPCEKSEEDGALDLSHVGVLVLENIWEADGKLQAALLGIADGRTNSLAVNQGKGLPRFKIITLLPDSRHSLFTANVRPDLCYLLQTLVLSVPPLRERREDLMGLFSLCLKSDSGQSRTDYGLEVGLSPIITGYSFPGNMYELRSVCRRYAMELSTGRLTLVGKKRLLIDCIGQEVLLDEVIFKAAGGRDLESLDSTELTGLVESMKEVLLYSNEQVAKKLGISRTSLWRRLQQK
ncbi:MAG: helix-turn-helix domain-containing protein, partial [Oscillospiraceae bacterium]